MLSREGDLAQIRFDWNGCTHHFEEKKWHIQSCKTNMDPKNDGLEEEFPSNYGDFLCPCQFSGEYIIESISHAVGLCFIWRLNHSRALPQMLGGILENSMGFNH